MVSWIVEQCGQLHLLYISLVIDGFTLHLPNNTVLKDLAEQAQTHTDVPLCVGIKLVQLVRSHLVQWPNLPAISH